MAHAAIAFTDQGGFTGESITNIICPAVDHASNFEQLRFMQEDVKAEKDRLQLLLNLATQVVTRRGASAAPPHRVGNNPPHHPVRSRCLSFA